MYSRDQRFVLVFTGEIYNYRELRTELLSAGQSFISQSHTEVLLASWQEGGVDSYLMTPMLAPIMLHLARNPSSRRPSSSAPPVNLWVISSIASVVRREILDKFGGAYRKTGSLTLRAESANP